jgi:aminomethyltransferase
VKDENGNEMGEVTSGTQSPTSGKIIGMAYVATPFSKSGTEIYMDIRGKLMKAVVTKAPFIQK